MFTRRVVAAVVVVGGAVAGVQFGADADRIRSGMVNAVRSGQPGRGPASRGPAGNLAGEPEATVTPGATVGPDSTGSPSATGSNAPSPAPEPTDDRASRDEFRSAPPSTAAVLIPGRPQLPGGGKATGKASPSAGTGRTGSRGCVASYYGVGKITASGEPYNPDGLTAAHPTLPFNTRIKVTNVADGRSVVVRVNDRGPYVAGRCLDLSTAAFRTIAAESSGIAIVRYEVLG